MTRAQLRVYAAAVRAELVARGTPVAPVAFDEMDLRTQLGEWIPLLQLRHAVVVTQRETLVIPVAEED